ncbi:DUF485 domain-containing protein [Streptomyces sp. CL12-4]|uniref:DUF485 domain-containing protein n=1 Tax=Streptomyces sp. CL12-4 TaxID=2810306 RepID=UPI001EFA330A|nr:DUF485 domain-containing protein [Streptomyces sp. CL12-4]MCG8967851.1 DUF485 domain-containing protein [Streptomyces sp. CL12-4]
MDTIGSPVGGDRYVTVHDSAQFKELRRRSNTFITWACVVFFGWWFVGSALATFAPGFFRQGVGGPVNVGLLFMALSLALVVTTSGVYLRHARTRLDPLSDRIRTDLEGDPR